MKVFFYTPVVAILMVAFTSCDQSQTASPAPEKPSHQAGQWWHEPEQSLPPAVDPYTEHDNDKADPAAYDKFTKLLAYYQELVKAEKAAVDKQEPGYFHRMHSDPRATTRQDVEAEKAHLRLWIASTYLKEQYCLLNREQKNRLSELKPPTLHLGMGGGDDLALFNDSEGRDAFERFIRYTFMSPDYIDSLSVAPKDRDRISKEVDETIKKL